MQKFATYFSKTSIAPDKIIVFFADEITYKSYNKNGLPDSNIQATSMEHYQATGQSSFQYPRGLVYTKDRIPWYIRADKGATRDRTEWVDLTDNVIMHQLSIPHHPETIIKTEAVAINPQKELAQTKKAVSIQQAGNIIKGIGMKADLNTGIIDILSHPEGYYNPPKDNSNSTSHEH